MISNRQGGRRRGRGGPRGQNLGGNRQDSRQRGNATQLLEKYKNMARDAQLAGDRVQSEYYLQYAEHYFRMLGENRPRFDDQRKQRGDDSSDNDDNDDNNNGNDRDDDSVEASDEDRGDKRQPRSRGNGRDRSDRNGAHKSQSQSDDEDERIALEVLPPAIGRESEDGEQAAPKPRRRARKPRSDGEETDVAPAA